MHIKYPKRKGFWTWEELGCLAKSLGFPRNLFYRNVPAEKEKRDIQGLDTKYIDYMIDTKALHPDLDRTFNMHDAGYNVKVIQRGMDCLINRYFTFEDINSARLAYQFYEHMDHAGVVMDEHTLLRAMKMSGRAISPLKMMQYVKHLDRLVPDRIMFYEFMEVLLIAERVQEKYERKEIDSQQPSRDDRNLYELNEFTDFLTTDDQRRCDKLNDEYQISIMRIPIHKPRKTTNEHHMHKKQWFVPPIVDHKNREKQVAKNKLHTSFLSEHLMHSTSQVLQTRCGPFCYCTRSISAPPALSSTRRTCIEAKEELEHRKYHHRNRISSAGPASRISSPLESNPLELKSHMRLSASDFRGTTPELLCRSSRTKKQEILVTAQDLYETHMALEDIRWEIETQDGSSNQREERKRKTKCTTEKETQIQGEMEEKKEVMASPKTNWQTNPVRANGSFGIELRKRIERDRSTTVIKKDAEEKVKSRLPGDHEGLKGTRNIANLQTSKLASKSAPDCLSERIEPQNLRPYNSMQLERLPLVSKEEITLDERLDRIRFTLDKNS